MGIIYDLLEKSKMKKNKERMKTIERLHNKKNKDNTYGNSEYKIVIHRYEDRDKEEKSYGKK